MEKILNEDIKCPHCGASIEADIEQKKLKQLYDRYNQCRDLELDRFWKNSVFVWVFLALCFTAFGTLVKDKYMPNKQLLPIDDDKYFLFLVIVSGIGLFLSFIWVWMARGLKAWYEVFEIAIWDMETNKNVFGYPSGYTIDSYWVVKDTKNDFQKLLVSSASISTSKIVILIGRFLILVWISAFLYSLWNYFDCFLYFDLSFENINWGFVISMVCTLWIIAKCHLLVGSSTLNTDEEKAFIKFISSKLQSKLNDVSMWNYVYYASVLKPFIDVKNITINHNKLFRRCKIKTSIAYYEVRSFDNNRLKSFNKELGKELVYYMNHVLKNHFDSGYYVISKVKLKNDSGKMLFKIKCHFSLWRYFNELLENNLGINLRKYCITINR